MTTGKTIALTISTVGKVMSLLFNMLSEFVIVFLLRSKYLLISRLQSLLEPKKIKSATVSLVSSTYLPRFPLMGPDAMILVF